VSTSERNEDGAKHPERRPPSPSSTPAILPLDELRGGSSCLANDGRCRTFLCVQHSLSSKWAIAPMEEWMDSNRQLVSVDDDRFKLARDGGLNLRNRIIRITIDQQGQQRSRGRDQ
jgi:hypothetical protein